MSPSAIRPRLLVLTSTYPRWNGDPEPGFVHQLSRRLAQRFVVTVLCPHARGASRAETMDGVDVVRYRYAPQRLELLVNEGGIVSNLRRKPWMWLLVPSFMLAQLFSAWRLVRNRKPDIVHAHWIVPQGLVAALLTALGVRVPFVVTSHGADLFTMRSGLLRAAKQWILRRAAHVTVVSETMRMELEALAVEPDRVSVLPMGIDTDVFHEDNSCRRSGTELLFVGRLVEKKGLRHLLDAMPSIVAANPEVRLTVLGFGPELEERKAQTAALHLLDHVRFVGAVSHDDLPGYYRRAAMLVAPFVRAASGDQEGLGLVPIEAMACGCPVVVSDLPATRDLGPDGPGLMRVQPGDPQRLALAVLSFLGTHRAAEVSHRAENFAWSERAAAYASLLEQIHARAD